MKVALDREVASCYSTVSLTENLCSMAVLPASYYTRLLKRNINFFSLCQGEVKIPNKQT